MLDLAQVKLHVIVGCLDPVDVRGVHEQDASARRDGDAVGRGGGGFDASEEGGQLALESGLAGRLGELPARAVQRLLESFAVERFQQVVERMDLERLEGKLVVGGHEY